MLSKHRGEAEAKSKSALKEVAVQGHNPAVVHSVGHGIHCTGHWVDIVAGLKV
jgi:hypothetical protein